MCVCACAAVYLNLHNLWVLSLPARKIKCLCCLFHTNSLKVTAWLMKGRKALATSQLAWWGGKSTALRSVMNEWVQERPTSGCQHQKKRSETTVLLMEVSDTTHRGVLPKNKNKKTLISCFVSFIGNTGDRRSLCNDPQGDVISKSRLWEVL